MSYNIDYSEYLKGKLTIKVLDAVELYRKLKDDMPECNFIEEIVDNPNYELNDVVGIENPWWYGEFSGHSYETTLRTCLVKTKGKATILFVWEGGDSQTALEVNNGKIKEKKVKVTVEDEE